MSDINEFLSQLWTAINPTVPMNLETGLYRAWAGGGYRDWGSPLAGEGTLDDGRPCQTFANAIVAWGDQGAEVITA